MKKTIPTMLLIAAFAANAGAQTVADALRFGDNNYYGTARSISMGNAFTALGGDLGSITINPAGSAVNNFSQVTVTPNLSIISSSAGYNSVPSQSDEYGSTSSNSELRFTIPNVAFTLNYKTGAKRGLKNITFGVMANATSNYLDNMSAGGRNVATTFAGALASQMTGAPSSALNGKDAYYNTNYPWNQITVWQSGIASNYGSQNTDYIGVTEKLIDNGDGTQTIQLADAIDQMYGRKAHGNKYDIVVNLGMNFSDRFYAGANIGIVSIDYKRNEYFKEYAANPDNFLIDYGDGKSTHFSDLRYRYAYDMQGAGIYAKFGFIAVPVNGLRIGAAIQTPAANFITEHWQHAGETYYTDSGYNSSATSPKGEYKYKFVSPYRFNVGVAYTFGHIGLVSADYELCDYSTMKFRETETNDNSVFDKGVNLDIKDYAGPAHTLRIGAEIKPVSSLAIRAGYNFSTSAERDYRIVEKRDNAGNVYTKEEKYTPKAYRHSFSAGVGYSSEGSFFCDLALRGTKYPYEYLYPYDTYIDGELSPEIRNSRRLWDIAFTFGWRF